MAQKKSVVRRKVARGSRVAALLTVLGLVWVWWLANDPPELSGPFPVETVGYDDDGVGTSADHVQCAAIRETDGPVVTDGRIALETLAEQEETTVEELRDGLVSRCDRKRDRRLVIVAMVMPVVVALAASTVALRVWLHRLQPPWRRAAEIDLPTVLALDQPRSQPPDGGDEE